ncbi:MAG: hypothetical protein NC218_11395 [Acetobacter sp.]|nr:hypothetical protein [Acetobacter sp.]
MKRFKKILYFVLGDIVVPFVLGAVNALIWGNEAFDYFYKYFLFVYFVCYLLFPVLYRKNMPKRFPNKYAFYGVMYLVFWVIGVVSLFC